MLAAVLNRHPNLLPSGTTSQLFTVPVDHQTLAATLVSPATPSTDRPLVLCLSGMGDNSAAYRFVAPRLASLGFTCVAVDYRGTGQSTGNLPPGCFGPQFVATDAEAVLLHHAKTREALLQQGVVVIAHSFTPASATWMASPDGLKADYIRGLVFLGPFPGPETRSHLP